MTDHDLRTDGRPPFSNGPFIEKRPNEIDFTPEHGWQWLNKYLVFRDTESPSGLQHHQVMPWRFRVNELVGNLLTQRAHQISVLFKKREMLQVSGRHNGIDLNGISSPTAEKYFDGLFWQLAFHQQGHELPLGNHLFPSYSHHIV